MATLLFFFLPAVLGNLYIIALLPLYILQLIELLKVSQKCKNKIKVENNIVNAHLNTQ